MKATPAQYVVSSHSPSRFEETLPSPWTASVVAPLVTIPMMLAIGSQYSIALPAFTATGAILLLVAGVVTYTDIREFRIPNWVTYPAFCWGLVINTLAGTPVGAACTDVLGAVGIGESLLGAFCLFVVMLVIFSFTGGGAGDVKLVAAIGALLGLGRGMDAVTYAMVLAGVAMLLISLFRYGPIRMVDSAVRPLASRLLPVWVDAPKAEHYQRMQSSVPLGPFFAAGIVMTLFDAGPDVQTLIRY